MIDLEYVVATSGRTGSNLLQRLLANNGLNNPHEWFHPTLFGYGEAAAGGVSTEQWLERMRREKTRDGVFAIKVMSTHPPQMLPHMERAVESPHEVVRTLFPDARFIYLWREDVERQALSFWRAQTTGKWTQWADERERPDQRPPLDMKVIESNIHNIERANAFWREYFDRFGVEPLELTYEQLDADNAGTIARVAEFLGRPIEGEPVLDVDIVRQADEITEQYLRELRAARRGGVGA